MGRIRTRKRFHILFHYPNNVIIQAAIKSHIKGGGISFVSAFLVLGAWILKNSQGESVIPKKNFFLNFLS
jgi:hypothetical protein